MRIVFIGLLIAGLQNAGGQQPAPAASPADTIRINREEVLLDVIVRDKKGRPVRDLQASDLTVLDNGKSRPVINVRLVEGSQPATRPAIEASGSTAKPLDPMRQVRLVTFVFERLDNESRRLAKQAALDMVKNSQQSNMYFSVLTLDQTIRVIQEFSNNRDAVSAAITRATSGAASDFMGDSTAMRGQLERQLGVNSNEASLTDQVSDRQQNAEAAMAGLGRGNSDSTAGGAALAQAMMARAMLDMMQFSVRASADQAGHATIDGLMAIIAGQKNLAGRKTVLYFSDGLVIPPAVTLRFQTLIGQANRANLSFYSVDARGLISQRMNAAGVDKLKAAMRASRDTTLRQSGAVTIDEVRAQDTAEESMRANNQQPLADLAEETGGFLIANTNDFRGPLRKVNEDINTYYEIAYDPGIERYDGSFHKTELKLNRADIKVQTRAGYFALPPSTKGGLVNPFEAPLLEVLNRKPAPRDLEFRAAALRLDPARANAGRALLVIEVPLDSIEFTTENGRYKAHLSLLGIVRDGKGEIVEKLSRDIPLEGEAERAAQLKKVRFIYREPFPVPPGRYTIETVVQDATTLKSSVRRSVFVMPRGIDTLAMSTPVLIRSYEANAANLETTDPLQFNHGKITPELASSISRNANAALYVVVYPDPANNAKPSMTAEYLKDGVPIASSEVSLQPAGGSSLSQIVAIPASNFNAGLYDVRLTVRQGSAVAEERLALTIE